ncbi:MAG: hypothetical protein WBD67_13750 [Terracidiphilus sp.]
MTLPFIITVDTEGDNLWANPVEIETRNAAFLPRFQALCEKHRFRPTYLTDFEMAISGEYQEFARDLLRRDTAEIGMHLHAWNTPPLAVNECATSSGKYLIEYPQAVMRGKIAFITGLLEETFGVKMHSHRAGRWAFDERYARMLSECGYTSDCSVTPGVSWRRHLGAPDGSGGSDYRGFPSRAYFLNLDNIRKPGDSALLEVPMTTQRRWERVASLLDPAAEPFPFARKVRDGLLFPVRWCRPQDRYYEGFRALVQSLGASQGYRGLTHLEFMIHSSELMPGGSPYFPSDRHVASLYEFLEEIFPEIARHCVGMTLREFYAHHCRRSDHAYA